MSDVNSNTTPTSNTGGETVDDAASVQGKGVLPAPEGNEEAKPVQDSAPAKEAAADKEQGKTGQGKTQGKADALADKPVAYKEFTIPEGLAPDKALGDEFRKLAGTMKLSQEQAQALVDLQTKAVKAQAEQFTRLRSGWLEEIYADADFGGDKIKKTADEAMLALQEYDPEGKAHKLLVQSGFQDNPDVLRFLARIGRERMKEGKILTSRSQGKDVEKPLMDRLWPE